MRRLRINAPPVGRARGALAVVLTLGACATLAACGSSGGSGSNGSAGASNQGSQQETAQLKLTQCLREHGVNIPDSGNRAAAIQSLAGVPQSTVRAAMAACRKYAAGSSAGASSRAEGVQRREAVRAYARCLRESGLNVPEPASSGGVSTFLQELREARANPKFAQANDKCQQKLPALGGGG